jgi:hypothetical protein
VHPISVQLQCKVNIIIDYEGFSCSSAELAHLHAEAELLICGVALGAELDGTNAVKGRADPWHQFITVIGNQVDAIKFLDDFRF